jgi:hypothetical protein
MSHQAKREYLLCIIKRYQEGSRQQKKLILDEFCSVCGYARKYAIRLLSGQVDLPKKPRPGAPRRYPKALLLSHIQFLWLAMERISSGRMKAALWDWLPYYKINGVTPEIKALLATMSESTLERFLKEIRANFKAKRGLSTTYPARFMKNRIPLNTLDKDVTQPGFTQADTVAHCGNSIAGSYANSITLTDIFSNWTENRALYQKKAPDIRHQINDIRQSLPFELLALNTDCGSEFLNEEMVGYMWNPYPGAKQITFTHSRPYKKNDQCWVEQKNFTHVRELFGYERFDDPALVPLMNEIYKNYWNPLQNFFIPNFKLIEKIRIGAMIKKKHDKPLTAFDRLMRSANLSEEQKQRLKERRSQLNPFTLKKGLEEKLNEFFRLVKQNNIREVA